MYCLDELVLVDIGFSNLPDNIRDYGDVVIRHGCEKASGGFKHQNEQQECVYRFLYLVAFFSQEDLLSTHISNVRVDGCRDGGVRILYLSADVMRGVSFADGNNHRFRRVSATGTIR